MAFQYTLCTIFQGSWL